MQTRLFKSGNSQAVRIPREFALPDAQADVEIERVGNTLVIRPISRPTLADLGDVLRGFSANFMTEGREMDGEPERDWNAGLSRV